MNTFLTVIGLWFGAALVLAVVWAVLGYRAKTRRTTNPTTTPKEGNHV
jgi:hypothetical protein